MSDAYKCDRCGEFFQREEPPPFFLKADKNRRTATKQKELDLKDLCDDCNNELDKWLLDGD